MQQILSANKSSESSKLNTSHVKQEPTEPTELNNSPPSAVSVQQTQMQQNAPFVFSPFISQSNYHQQISVPLQLNNNNNNYSQFLQPPKYPLYPAQVQSLNFGINNQPASFFIPQHSQMMPHQPLYYHHHQQHHHQQQQQHTGGLMFHQAFNQLSFPNPIINYQQQHQQLPLPPLSLNNQSQHILLYPPRPPNPTHLVGQNSYYRKRKFGEINNNISNNSSINNATTNIRYRPPNQQQNQSKLNSSISVSLNEANGN